jgi:hypothetical protein
MTSVNFYAEKMLRNTTLYKNKVNQSLVWDLILKGWALLIKLTMNARVA